MAVGVGVVGRLEVDKGLWCSLVGMVDMEYLLEVAAADLAAVAAVNYFALEVVQSITKDERTFGALR